MSKFMDAAIREAQAAALRNEVPVGAVLVKEGKILAQNGNRTRETLDPSAHAEMLVIREATTLIGSERLTGCDLYVTLEPCAMCAAVISYARISRLYFGASDEKSGGVENGVQFFMNKNCHHRPEIYEGIQAEMCSQILREFFASKR